MPDVNLYSFAAERACGLRGSVEPVEEPCFLCLSYPGTGVFKNLFILGC